MQALQYNVPRGKKNRGLATIFAFKTLAKPEDITPENLKLAQYLGWCVEMVSYRAITLVIKKFEIFFENNVQYFKAF